MTRRTLLSVLTLACLPLAARAGTVEFAIHVDTSSIVAAGGWIDFQFNQANAIDSLSATAAITQFSSTGFAFGPTILTTPGVTGDLFTLPATIPNDQAAANYLTHEVVTWGSFFDVFVVLDGPAVGTSAPNGSGFFIFLLDSGFSPIVGPLGAGEVFNLTLDPNGDVTAEGSDFAVVVPEPATMWLCVGGLAGAALVRRKRRG